MAKFHVGLADRGFGYDLQMNMDLSMASSVISALLEYGANLESGAVQERSDCFNLALQIGQARKDLES